MSLHLRSLGNQLQTAYCIAHPGTSHGQQANQSGDLRQGLDISSLPLQQPPMLLNDEFLTSGDFVQGLHKVVAKFSWTDCSKLLIYYHCLFNDLQCFFLTMNIPQAIGEDSQGPGKHRMDSSQTECSKLLIYPHCLLASASS